MGIIRFPINRVAGSWYGVIDDSLVSLDAETLDGLDSTAFLKVANNLSDLANAATARSNLSVYSIAQVDAALAGKSNVGHTHEHDTLTGLADDDHSQYALLAGRSGGQTLKGGTGSGDDLTITSTNHATKGTIFLGTVGAIDEVNSRIGIGTLTPSDTFHMRKDVDGQSRVGFFQNGEATVGSTNEECAIDLVVTGSAGSGVARFVCGKEADHSSVAAIDTFFALLVSENDVKVERMRVKSNGFVGLGTTSPDGKFHSHSGSAGSVTANTIADEGVFEQSDHGGISILTPAEKQGTILFGSPTDNARGQIYYEHDVDKMTLNSTAAAGVFAIRAASADRLRVSADGVAIGADIAPVAGVGLLINQGAADTSIVEFRSTDIAHGMTTLANTSTYAHWEKSDGALGGLSMIGYTEDILAFHLVGRYTTGVTTKSAAGMGAIAMTAAKKTGTSAGAPAADENLLVVRSHTNTRFIVDVDGDIHMDATSNINAWDEHDDVALLTSYRALTMDRKAAKRWFGEFIEEHAQVLHDTGVITLNEDGRHFVSFKGLSALIIDAIRQLKERQDRIETLLLPGAA